MNQIYDISGPNTSQLDMILKENKIPTQRKRMGHHRYGRTIQRKTLALK